MTVYFSEIVEHPLKSIAAVFRVASGYSRLDRLDPDSACRISATMAQLMTRCQAGCVAGARQAQRLARFGGWPRARCIASERELV